MLITTEFGAWHADALMRIKCSFASSFIDVSTKTVKQRYSGCRLRVAMAMLKHVYC